MNPFQETIRRALVISLVILVTAVPAVAGVAPDNLSDLEYQDSGWGENELRHRGYSLISSDDHRGTHFEYWWDGATCVQVQVRDYKVQEVSTTTPTDCGQYHQEAIKDHKGGVLAAAAAALIGAAVLSHESHHRDGKHGDDAQSISEFDRGYRDGLHREDYHNYNDTPAYSDGFDAGVRERDEQTSHRSRSGHQSGYQSHVSLSDLVDARASSAESELESRGFRSGSGYKKGDRSMVLWYNGETHQCVQVTTREGRIEVIDDLSEGNCQ